jgi:hypothetical protein
VPATVQTPATKGSVPAAGIAKVAPKDDVLATVGSKAQDTAASSPVRLPVRPADMTSIAGGGPAAVDSMLAQLAPATKEAVSKVVLGGGDRGAHSGPLASPTDFRHPALPAHAFGPERPSTGSGNLATIPTLSLNSLASAPLTELAGGPGARDLGSGDRPANPPTPPGGPDLGGSSSNSFFSFGLAALLIAALYLAASPRGRRVRSRPVSWRPVLFVSLLERPG